MDQKSVIEIVLTRNVLLRDDITGIRKQWKSEDQQFSLITASMERLHYKMNLNPNVDCWELWDRQGEYFEGVEYHESFIELNRFLEEEYKIKLILKEPEEKNGSIN